MLPPEKWLQSPKQFEAYSTCRLFVGMASEEQPALIGGLILVLEDPTLTQPWDWAWQAVLWYLCSYLLALCMKENCIHTDINGAGNMRLTCCYETESRRFISQSQIWLIVLVAVLLTDTSIIKHVESPLEYRAVFPTRRRFELALI